MISSSQLQKNPFQSMDSYYVLSDSIQGNNSICDAVLELFEYTSHKSKQLRGGPFLVEWT